MLGFAAEGERRTGGGGGVLVRGAVETGLGVAAGGGLFVALDVELGFCGTQPVRAASETESKPESERRRFMFVRSRAVRSACGRYQFTAKPDTTNARR